MAATTTRLTAMGGIPIISESRQGSSSTDPFSLINIERLLSRIETQLDEEARSKSSDPWKSSGIAISLTHANSLVNQIPSQTGISLQSRLQNLTRKYVQLFQSEQQQPLQQMNGLQTQRSDTFDSRSYLIQDDLLEDTDTESEFDDNTWDGKEAENAPIGGVKEEEENAASLQETKGNEERDEDYDEYETATELRRRANATSKETEIKSKDESSSTSIDQIPPTALQSERSIQDSLSGELLRMAGILKANSIKFADSLERDRRILEQADEKLQGNLTLMTRTRGKLGEYSRKARGMGWITLGAVAMVCSSWVVMFILIRLT